MRKNTKGKLMVALLSLAMVLTFIPMMAFADEEGSEEPTNPPVEGVTIEGEENLEPGGDSQPNIVEEDIVVTFVVGDHGTAPAPKSFPMGGKVPKPEDPTAEGWVFEGWYTSLDESEPFDFDTKVYENIVLYAKWTKVSDYPALATYSIVYGANGTWMKDSGKDYKLVVKRSEEDEYCFDNFDKLCIDGKELERGVDYEAKEGSTILIIKDVTLQKYMVGEHKVKIFFDDPDAEGAENDIVELETNLTIKEPVTTTPVKRFKTVVVNRYEVPRTGDANHVGMWFIVMIIAFAGVGGAAAYNRKRRNDR
mgnify:FL=1